MESSLIQRRAYWKSWDFDGPGKLGRGNVGNYTRRDSLNETVFSGRAIAVGISGRGGVSRWRHGRESALILLAFFSQTKIYKFQNVIGPSSLSFFLSHNSSPYACPRHRISQQTQSYVSINIKHAM